MFRLQLHWLNANINSRESSLILKKMKNTSLLVNYVCSGIIKERDLEWRLLVALFQEMEIMYLWPI